MINVENFDPALKHPFLRDYTIDACGILVDVKCDTNGKWSVSNLEYYEYARKLADCIYIVSLRSIEEPFMYETNRNIAPPLNKPKTLLDKK